MNRPFFKATQYCDQCGEKKRTVRQTIGASGLRVFLCAECRQGLADTIRETGKALEEKQR